MENYKLILLVFVIHLLILMLITMVTYSNNSKNNSLDIPNDFINLNPNAFANYADGILPVFQNFNQINQKNNTIPNILNSHLPEATIHMLLEETDDRKQKNS